jgi:hypothetical protein
MEQYMPDLPDKYSQNKPRCMWEQFMLWLHQHNHGPTNETAQNSKVLPDQEEKGADPGCPASHLCHVHPAAALPTSNSWYTGTGTRFTGSTRIHVTATRPIGSDVNAARRDVWLMRGGFLVFTAILLSGTGIAIAQQNWASAAMLVIAAIIPHTIEFIGKKQHD